VGGAPEALVERNTAMAYRAQTIDDLLADSLIQKVMLADRVEPHALKSLLNETASLSPTRGVRAPSRSVRISAGAARFADRCC
jgi:hypothetical protein